MFEALGNLSTAAGVACDERPTRWASWCHILSDNLRETIIVEDRKLVHGFLPIFGRSAPVGSDFSERQPATSGYGDKAPQYAAFIVQHADLPYQEKYLPMMQAAADSKELAPRHVAMLVDRVLMRKNLPQRYGSQLTMKDGKLVVYPIEEPDHVNDRRSQVGMVPASFCAYIASFTPTPQSDLCEFSKPRNAASQ